MIGKLKITMAAGALTTGLLGAVLPATLSHAATHPDTIIVICDYTVVVDQAAVHYSADVDSRVLEWEPKGATSKGLNGYIVGNGANFTHVFGGYVKVSDLQKHDCL